MSAFTNRHSFSYFNDSEVLLYTLMTLFIHSVTENKVYRLNLLIFFKKTVRQRP